MPTGEGSFCCCDQNLGPEEVWEERGHLVFLADYSSSF